MKRKNVTLLIILGLLVLCLPVRAIIWVNDIIPPWDLSASKIIEAHVTKGASLYFHANAAIMTLFAEAEVQSILDYKPKKSLKLARAALDYLEQAKNQYTQAAQLGIAAGYIPNRQSLLITFNYDTYAVQQNLNPVIKDRVKKYLAVGDVAGFYQHTANDIEDLILLVRDAENSLKQGVRPPIKVLWALVQKLSETTMFGHYGTYMAQAAFGNGN